MIKGTQLINEAIAGLNYLSQKLESKEFNEGIIGPVTSTLFLIILMLHSEYKKMPSDQMILKDYYQYCTNDKANDFTMIGIMRHSLAHSEFIFQINSLKFICSKFGNLDLPYSALASLTNKMLLIYNKLIATQN